MFGYEGEPEGQMAEFAAKRAAAQQRWPFLTSLDLSMIHNEVQLASIVKDRTGHSRPEADADVRTWLHDRDRTSTKVTSLQRWTDDGGSHRSGKRRSR